MKGKVIVPEFGPADGPRLRAQLFGLIQVLTLEAKMNLPGRDKGKLLNDAIEKGRPQPPPEEELGGGDICSPEPAVDDLDYVEGAEIAQSTRHGC